MSEFYDDEESLPLDPNIREQLKRADKDRKARSEAEARAEAAERQLALIKAGIPAEGPGELFHRAYDGPLDTDAIRAEAQRYGLWSEQPQEVPPSVPQDPAVQYDQQVYAELQQMQQHQQAMAGPFGHSVAPDPGQELLAKVKAATSADEVMELMAQAEISHPELNIFTSRTGRN